jgi:biotin carboxyl carrier protein
MATYSVKSNGKQYTVTVVDKATGGGRVTIDDREFDVEFTGGDASSVSPRSLEAVSSGPPTPSSAAAPVPVAAVPVGEGAIVAPIHGKIVAIHVKVGDRVSADQVVLMLEAMKMENEIASPVSGTVTEIAVSEGTEAAGGQLLMLIG